MARSRPSPRRAQTQALISSGKIDVTKLPRTLSYYQTDPKTGKFTLKPQYQKIADKQVADKKKTTTPKKQDPKTTTTTTKKTTTTPTTPVKKAVVVPKDIDKRGYVYTSATKLTPEQRAEINRQQRVAQQNLVRTDYAAAVKRNKALPPPVWAQNSAQTRVAPVARVGIPMASQQALVTGPNQAGQQAGVFGGRGYPASGEGSLMNINGQQYLRGPLGFPVPIAAAGGGAKGVAAQPAAYGTTKTKIGTGLTPTQTGTARTQNIARGGRVRPNFAGGGKVAGFGTMKPMGAGAGRAGMLAQAQLLKKRASDARQSPGGTGGIGGVTVSRAQTVRAKPAMLAQAQALRAKKAAGAGSTATAAKPRMMAFKKGGKVPPQFAKKAGTKGAAKKGNPFAKAKKGVNPFAKMRGK